MEFEDVGAWRAKRLWAVNATRAKEETRGSEPGGGKVYVPRSAAQVAGLLAATCKLNDAGDPGTGTVLSVAAVCGGHNTAANVDWADVIVDLKHLDGIWFNSDDSLVRVEAGVQMKELVEAVASRGKALPVGTGQTVGVCGYLVNGGMSGYFSKALGLLGQRVKSLQVVLSDGTLRQVDSDSKDEAGELYFALLGAGSALGIVTAVTLELADGNIVQSAGQLVVPCGTLENARQYARGALAFLKDSVLPSADVSMELVVTADLTAITTLVFYTSGQTIDNQRKEFAQPLRSLASSLGLSLVDDNLEKWTTWKQVASCLWPVIDGMKGSPMAMLEHCCGSSSSPSEADLDFVANVWIAQSPLEKAPMSIVEARSVGGMVCHKRAIPSGNYHQSFFCDMIIAFDKGAVSESERQAICAETAVIAIKAQSTGLTVDFSATHKSDGDATRLDSASVFGSDANFQRILAVKRALDPDNRFQHHPFSSLL